MPYARIVDHVCCFPRRTSRRPAALRATTGRSHKDAIDLTRSDIGWCDTVRGLGEGNTSVKSTVRSAKVKDAHMTVVARRSGTVAQGIEEFPQEPPRKTRNDFGEIEIRAALPRTPVGKLSKKELYDEINAKAAAAKAAP
jgi:hypothetical protein